jgi:hypothetical protein
MPAYRDIAELLLRAYRTRRPGLSVKFMLADASDRRGSIGIELFRDPIMLRRASLMLVQIEPTLFESEPISSVVSLLEKFFTASTYLIGNNQLFLAMKNDVVVADIAAPDAVARIAEGLLAYVHAEKATHLHLAPVNRIAPENDVVSPNLIIVRGHPQLESVLSSLPTSLPAIQGDGSPPFEFPGRINMLGKSDCWIGCLASSENAALSKLRRIQGALCSVLPLGESMLFSGDLPLCGKTTIRSDGEMTFNTSRLFPTLLNPQTISCSMLNDMSDLIDGRVLIGESRRRVDIALEFVATSWISSSRMRFFNNAITFDALFGVQVKVRQSIVAGVTRYASAISKVSVRIELLLRMRNALLHGEAANIEETPQYRGYYEEFDVDPVSDQWSILRTCLFGLIGKSPNDPLQ